MTFSKRMMFLNVFLVALSASALLLSCDLGTNSGDDNVPLQSARSTVLSDEKGTYVGTLTVQMDVPIVFTITLYLNANNNFVYASRSDRGNADLNGTYTLIGGTLTLQDTGGVLAGKVYDYEGSTVDGRWYLGEAPFAVFRPTTLTKQ
jgi:hypothetical protein